MCSWVFADLTRMWKNHRFWKLLIALGCCWWTGRVAVQEIDNSFDKVMWRIVALPDKYSLDFFFKCIWSFWSYLYDLIWKWMYELYERTVCLMWHCTMSTLSVVTKVYIFGVFVLAVFFSARFLSEEECEAGCWGRPPKPGETFEPWIGPERLCFWPWLPGFFARKVRSSCSLSFFSLCGNGGGQESSKLIVDHKVYEGLALSNEHLYVSLRFARILEFERYQKLDSLA